MFDRDTDTAFLRTILAHPEDDAPRLIYADWLDEQGDADRAEFIRLQIHLARMAPGDPGWGAMYARSFDLKQAHHVEWINRLPQFEHVHWEIFDRGFISAARFDDADTYFAKARHVFAAAPIAELRLHQFLWPNATRLGESRWLRRVRVLDFGDGNRVANQGTEGLVKSPHLAHLRTLNLSQNSLGSVAARTIGTAPYMRSLRVLKLDRNDLFSDGLRYLAESPNMSHLEVLDMDRTRTGDDGVQALAASKHIRQLRLLFLSNNQITNVGLMALVQSEVLRGVKTLFVSGNSIGDAGVRALTASPMTAQIERLYLRRNQIGDEGAFALARWQRSAPLRELHVGENRISPLAASELQALLGKAVNVY